MQRRAGGEFEFADGPSSRGPHGVRTSEQEAEERLRQKDRQAELRRRNEGLSVPGSEGESTPSKGKAAQAKADVQFRQAMARHTQRMRRAADARGFDQRSRRLTVDVPTQDETASIVGGPIFAFVLMVGSVAFGLMIAI